MQYSSLIHLYKWLLLHSMLTDRETKQSAPGDQSSTWLSPPTAWSSSAAWATVGADSLPSVTAYGVPSVTHSRMADSRCRLLDAEVPGVPRGWPLPSDRPPSYGSVLAPLDKRSCVWALGDPEPMWGWMACPSVSVTVSMALDSLCLAVWRRGVH